MNKKTQQLTQGALIAAIYAALCHLQNLLLPGSASWAIQFRVAEALCVLAFFTPAAIPGLTIGCLLFNLTFAGALPLDPILGTAASLLSAVAMWLLRKHPLPGLLMPALFNGLLVGWELALFIGDSFWLNCLYVALGEAGVLLTLGAILYSVIRHRHLDQRFFYTSR